MDPLPPERFGLARVDPAALAALRDALGAERVSTELDGPFTLVEARKECGDRYSGIQRSCEFDIASGGATRARYVRVEDGELFPCPGGTVSEGADLDAVEALHGAFTRASGPSE